jgi:N-acetyl-gamma-glutamyl-phosphate reductase common form
MVKSTVVGASGYMGGELLRLLVRHPKVESIIPVSRTHAGKPVSSVQKNLLKVFDEPFVDLDLSKIDSEIVFFAAPPGDWFAQVPSLLERGIKVITLGGKYRMQDAALDKKIYGGYENAALLAERVYGLPELYRKEIKGARFVTNPGCYATSVILACLPFAKMQDKVDLEKVAVTAVSGTSGAGASPSEFLHHPEMCGTVKPYKVLSHRHLPEIESILADAYGKKMRVSFTPSVANMSRGIMSFVTLFAGGLKTDLTKHFEGYYRGEPFVRVIRGAEENVPELLNVVGTNFCDVGVNYDPAHKRILVLSTLDNLIKGGSGQAVQNMNLMLRFKEEAGLELVGGYP